MWNIHNNITLSDIVDTLLHGLEGGRGKKRGLLVCESGKSGTSGARGLRGFSIVISPDSRVSRVFFIQ